MNKIHNDYPGQRFHPTYKKAEKKFYRAQKGLVDLGYPKGTQTDDRAEGMLRSLAASAGLIFLHECGHAIAATLLYRDANPKIRFSPFGGSCTYQSTKPRKLGDWFGPSNSSALVSSAGPAVEIISMLAVTKLTRGGKRPAQLMLPKALSLSLYALSALFLPYRPEHDFCEIWSKSGRVAYGLLTACSLATTALVWRNAMKTLTKPERQKTANGSASKSFQSRPRFLL